MLWAVHNTTQVMGSTEQNTDMMGVQQQVTRT
jgi:hypothetical protein